MFGLIHPAIYSVLQSLLFMGLFSQPMMFEGEEKSDSLPEVTAIHTQNIKPKSVVQYPFLIIKGKLQTSHPIEQFIRGADLWVERAARERAYSVALTLTTESGTLPTTYPVSVYRDEFKALVELHPGNNTVHLQSGSAMLTFSMTYRPLQATRKLRFFYLTDSTGDTRYNTPFRYDKQNYLAKIDTAAKMLQAMIAEGTNRFGVGKRTFALELDEHGKVEVHTVHTHYPARYLNTLQGFNYWDVLREEAIHHHPLKSDIFVLIVAIEHPNSQQITPNRKYLGGGQVAVVSSRGMFAWPTRVQDIIPTFYDNNPVDTEYRIEDSAHRGTVWGVASLSLGAMLHEIAHAFGLLHTANPNCTLNTGYANFHRSFVMDDAPSLLNALPVGQTLAEQKACPIDHTKDILRIPWLYPASQASLVPNKATTKRN